MKISKLLLGLIVITGCGVHVSSDPVNVNVKHSFSLTEIATALRADCKRQLGNGATTEEIEECTQEKLAQFIEDIVGSL